MIDVKCRERVLAENYPNLFSSAPMMEKYLQRICQLRQNIRDPADYEHFAMAMEKHIRGTPAVERESVEALLDALKTFKKPFFIGLIYRILAAIEENRSHSESHAAGLPLVPLDVVKRHIRCPQITNDVLGYINRTGIRKLDQFIAKRLIEHDPFSSRELFCFIVNRPELASSFMSRRDNPALFKQLSIMSNCYIPCDLHYLAGALGSESRVVAAKAYEAFTSQFIFRSNEEKAPCSFVGPTNRILFHTSLLIVPDTTMCVESVRNFIVFGFNFITARDELLLALEARDGDGVCSILRRLIPGHSEVAFEGISDLTISDLAWSVPIPGEEPVESSETNFEYLFTGKSYKNCCACAEL